ncbi:MAG: pyridoxine 5'-phosphate synthase [Planctomycetes bacterium]|nr:pyridoxine 5'-phosphate synthase [Planctomycetota bacterium]
MVKLGVNIDHVATVRQARRTDEPDPVWAAVEAELGGADGITFHLREDRRHINDRDARVLKETVAAKLNMEMSIAAGIVRIAGELKPDQCTLVPEKREELTTEGGLNVRKFARRIKRVVSDLHNKGITLSAFIEPDVDQIRASADCGFDAVELWTGGYAHAKTARAIQREIKRLDRGVETGIECDMEVHGGHGLTYRNIDRIAAIPGFGEFNIGHSIVARATLVGMRAAVEQMKDLLYQYSPVELM